MAVNYSTTVKNTRMSAMVSAIDAGAGVGNLEICNAAYALVLATFALVKPSFTVTGGVATLASVPRSDTSADNTGTAALARFKDSTGTVVVDGLTVGVGSGDIQLNSINLTAGQTVAITSGTITHG